MFDYFQEERVTVKLAPNQVIFGNVDMGKIYDKNLMPGLYHGEVTYLYGSGIDTLVRSTSFMIEIVEPKTDEEKAGMNLFVSAKNQYWAGMYHSAAQTFSQLNDEYKNTEYARVGRYYQALAHSAAKEHEQAAVALLQYLRQPALKGLPGIVNQDTIQLKLGIFYLDGKKLKEAKQTFEKISDPALSDIKKYYLQEIENAK